MDKEEFRKILKRIKSGKRDITLLESRSSLVGAINKYGDMELVNSYLFRQPPLEITQPEDDGIYFFPTQDVLSVIVKTVLKINPSLVLEVCAGNGYASYLLQPLLSPIEYVAIDDMSFRYKRFNYPVTKLTIKKALDKYGKNRPFLLAFLPSPPSILIPELFQGIKKYKLHLIMCTYNSYIRKVHVSAQRYKLKVRKIKVDTLVHGDITDFRTRGQFISHIGAPKSSLFLISHK